MLPPTLPPHTSDPHYALYLHESRAAAIYGAHRLPPSSSAHLASLMDNKAALLADNKLMLGGNGPLDPVASLYPGGRPSASVYDPRRSPHPLDNRQRNPFHTGLPGELPHHLRDPSVSISSDHVFCRHVSQITRILTCPCDVYISHTSVICYMLLFEVIQKNNKG